MWVHGGTTHLGLSSAWIARLDEADIFGLFENQDSSWGEARRSEKPRLPIAHIVEHPTKDELYAFAFNELAGVDVIAMIADRIAAKVSSSPSAIAASSTLLLSSVGSEIIPPVLTSSKGARV